MSTKKSQRLINLFAKLIYSRYHHPTWTEIADQVDGYGDSHSETSKRMFERDKDILRKLGIPVKTDSDDDGEHRYYIDPDDYYLPPLSLSHEEVAIIGLALQLMEAAPSLPFREYLPGAALKMTFGLGASLPPAEDRVKISLGRESAEQFEIFDRGASEGKRISFNYRGMNDLRPRGRTIETHTRFYRDGAWYISGRCLDSGQIRTFRADRIMDTPLILDSGSPEPAYEIPDSALQREAGEFYWQSTDSANGTTLATILMNEKAPGSFLRRLKATQGVPVELPVSDPDAFINWVISLGPAIHLLGPSELVSKLNDKLRRAASVLAIAPVENYSARTLTTDGGAAPASSATKPPVRIKDQFERLLVLLPYLVSNQGVTVTQACMRFGMSRKELISDLDLIRLCGLPPYTPDTMIDYYIQDNDSIEILMADYLSRPARLTPGQATSLLFSLEALAKSPMVKDRAALSSLISKIRELVNPVGSAPNEANRLSVWLDLDAGTTDEILSAISSALVDHRELQISYLAAGGNRTSRMVQPYSTVCFAGNWYLIAYCCLRGAFRTFRIDRIETATPSVAHFEPDWSRVPDHLSDGELFTTAADAKFSVVINAGHRVALLARPFSRVISEGDDRYTLIIDTPSLDWLIPLILQWGDEASIIAPGELASQAARQANCILAMYNKEQGN